MEMKFPEVPVEERLSPGEANIAEIRTAQVAALNNVLKQKWKTARKRSVTPQLEFTDRPDNPWRDRYLLCGDCERCQDYKGQLPKSGCSGSSLLEIDMTSPFSRENVVTISCEVAQMIREDVWVRRDEEGSFRRVEGKQKLAGSFPVQVCAVCRKTTLNEHRKFKVCPTCEGVAYCSDECCAQDRMRHKVNCTLPHLPDRQEWGVRKQLRSMLGEIYPMHLTWAIREPAEHRIAWLPAPRRNDAGALEGADVRRPMLPGFKNHLQLLPTSYGHTAEVKDGKVAIVVQRTNFRLRKAMETSRIPDPDPEQLLTLGMTREEFLHRDAQLRAAAARENQRELDAFVAAEAEAAVAATAAAGARELTDLTAMERWSRLRLENEGIQRIEAAAQDAPSEPPARTPWEELEAEDVDKRHAERVGGSRKALAEASERKREKGVVKKLTPVEEVVKTSGLKLSPEAVKKLEAAAAAVQKDEKNWKVYQAPIQNEFSPFKTPQKDLWKS